MPDFQIPTRIQARRQLDRDKLSLGLCRANCSGGNGALPIVGRPDHVAGMMMCLSECGVWRWRWDSPTI